MEICLKMPQQKTLTVVLWCLYPYWGATSLQDAWKAREAELLKELEELRAHAVDREAEVEEKVNHAQQQVDLLLPELQASSNAMAGANEQHQVELVEASKTFGNQPMMLKLYHYNLEIWRAFFLMLFHTRLPSFHSAVRIRYFIDIMTKSNTLKPASFKNICILL